MNYTEKKKIVMDCLSQFNDRNENVAETLFNVYPAEMNALVRLVKNCRIANVGRPLSCPKCGCESMFKSALYWNCNRCDNSWIEG